MSETRKKWIFADADDANARALADAEKLPEAIARALAARGFRVDDDFRGFLNPKLADLSDPFLLPDMRAAVTRVWRAIRENEGVTVFGDYDVDGVTSAALLTRALKALGAKVRFFIPDRLDEGYGLSSEALERCLAEHGSRVVISVDCGVNSVESVAAAQAKGVDVIVTDHHEPEAETAPAFALINPKLGAERSLDILSGVGVAFKVAHALVKQGRADNEAAALALDLRDYLDIAALGTVADIVPLVGENRVIVRHGLARLAETRWVGLEALKNVAGVKGEPDTYHLGFQLGPRINAAGRIGEPMKALGLLISDDPAEARRVAKLLDDNNTERRRIEREITEAAFAEIESYYDPETCYGLVVAREGWHPGVVGIVASRVSRHYNRPAIIMSVDPEGAARGSCRGIETYDLLEGLRDQADKLAKFGGHKMAAGLEIKPGELEAFKRGFNAAVAKTLAEEDLAPTLKIDAETNPADIDWDFMDALKRLRPFGQNNPEPVWVARKLAVSGSPRVVGGNHLKLTLAKDGKLFEAIAFNHPLERLPSGLLDVAFTLKENHWMGDTSLQWQLLDIRPAE